MTRLARFIEAACVGTGLVLLAVCMPLAKAAQERPAPPPGYEWAVGFEITLYWDRPTGDNRMHQIISAPYPEREACTNAIKRVRVMVKGGRLRCDQVDELRKVQP